MTPQDFLFIEAGPEHVDFIAHSWLKSMKGAPGFEGMPDDDYYSWMKRTIASHIAESPAIVAVDEQEPSTVVAYLVYRGDTLLFAYTRKDFRGNGFFKTLKEYSGVRSYAYRSRSWSPSRSRDLVYRPFFTR